MAQQDRTGDLSMEGRRLRRVVAGRVFQVPIINCTTAREERVFVCTVLAETGMKEDSSMLREKRVGQDRWQTDMAE